MFVTLLDSDVCLVIFCSEDSESRGLRDKLDATGSRAEAEAPFEVEKSFRDNPVARAGKEESESNRFGLDYLVVGRLELGDEGES